MNAEKALLNAYREWRRLAEAEGRAIHLRNWKLLSECQKILKSLQPVVTHLLNESRDEWRRLGLNLVEKENFIHAIVLELLKIARNNEHSLQAASRAAQLKLDQLGQSRRNLSRIQNSYAPAISAS